MKCLLSPLWTSAQRWALPSFVAGPQEKPSHPPGERLLVCACSRACCCMWHAAAERRGKPHGLWNEDATGEKASSLVLSDGAQPTGGPLPSLESHVRARSWQSFNNTFLLLDCSKQGAQASGKLNERINLSSFPLGGRHPCRNKVNQDTYSRICVGFREQRVTAILCMA